MEGIPVIQGENCEVRQTLCCCTDNINSLHRCTHSGLSCAPQTHFHCQSRGQRLQSHKNVAERKNKKKQSEVPEKQGSRELE